MACSYGTTPSQSRKKQNPTIPYQPSIPSMSALYDPQILQQTRIYGGFRALIQLSDCVLSVRQMVKWKILQGTTKATFYDMHMTEKNLG